MHESTHVFELTHTLPKFPMFLGDDVEIPNSPHYMFTAFRISKHNSSDNAVEKRVLVNEILTISASFLMVYLPDRKAGNCDWQ